MTQCQDEFRNLSGCVLKILTTGRILQISIDWCQIEAEIHSFPTMYGKKTNFHYVKVTLSSLPLFLDVIASSSC